MTIFFSVIKSEHNFDKKKTLCACKLVENKCNSWKCYKGISCAFIFVATFMKKKKHMAQCYVQAKNYGVSMCSTQYYAVTMIFSLLFKVISYGGLKYLIWLTHLGVELLHTTVQCNIHMDNS